MIIAIGWEASGDIADRFVDRALGPVIVEE